MPIRPSGKRSSAVEILAISTRLKSTTSSTDVNAWTVLRLQIAINGQSLQPPFWGILRSAASGQHGISPDISADDIAISADLANAGALTGANNKPMTMPNARTRRTQKDRFIFVESHKHAILRSTPWSRLRDMLTVCVFKTSLQKTGILLQLLETLRNMGPKARTPVSRDSQSMTKARCLRAFLSLKIIFLQSTHWLAGDAVMIAPVSTGLPC